MKRSRISGWPGRVVRAHAPGKLFLTGEWAVLGGAPALVAAVDRRATVEVCSTEGDAIVVESRAEGHAVRLEGAAPMPGGDAGVVLAALRAWRRAPRGLFVTVDARPFVRGSYKLGLGRSAAALVAAVAALAPDATREGVLEAALTANALFQGGRGSGADVGAAVHGGLVEARRRGSTLALVPRQLPPGLHLVAGWTRTSAHTPPLLARFDPASPPPVFAELVDTAEQAADAVARQDAGTLLETVERTAGLLERFGTALGLPLVTPELATLVRAAASVGAAAKPSGAGAGDCGIALCRSAAEAAAVHDAWREVGIEPLDLDLAHEGVCVE